MNDHNHTYQGKYVSPKQRNPRRRLRWRKQFVLVCTTVALLLGVVGGSLAYLTTDTDPVENNFEPGNVACEIKETMENNVKSDVKVQNTGNTDAFIRARIVVTWQDGQGNVYSKPPVAGTDYSISIITGEGWEQNGSYYYYTKTVAPGAITDTKNLTSVLISECKPLKAAPGEGYTLHVEILADAIQSSPATAVQEAWKVTISENSVTAVSSGN